MYGVVERKSLFGKTSYEVVKSKTGLGGTGYIPVASFKDKDDAERYKEEQEYLAEQKRLDYESRPNEDKPLISVSRQDWDRHVADCYNDWNRAHGYR